MAGQKLQRQLEKIEANHKIWKWNLFLNMEANSTSREILHYHNKNNKKIKSRLISSKY